MFSCWFDVSVCLLYTVGLFICFVLGLWQIQPCAFRNSWEFRWKSSIPSYTVWQQGSEIHMVCGKPCLPEQVSIPDSCDHESFSLPRLKKLFWDYKNFSFDFQTKSHNFFKCFFFLRFCFSIWTIFKVFSEFVTIFLLFLCFGFLVVRHMGSQLSNQGSNPHSLHWKVKSQPLDLHRNPSSSLKMLTSITFCVLLWV